MVIMHNKIKKLIALFSLALLGACGSTVIDNCSKPTAEVFLELVSFNVQDKANNDTAVALDLVILYDKTLIKTFLALSASDYFKKKKQLILDYPIQMQVKSWEIVPAQKITPYSVKFSHPLPQAAFFYANYSTAGDHRQRIGDQKGIQVVLGKTDMSLRELSNTEIQALLLASPKTTHSGLSSISETKNCSNCCCCCNASARTQSSSCHNSLPTSTTSPSSIRAFTGNDTSSHKAQNFSSQSKSASSSPTSKAKQQAANRAQDAQDVLKDMARAQQTANRAQDAQDVLKDMEKAQQTANRAQDAQDVLKDLASAQ